MRPDEFLSKTKWQRFQVLIMGPTMNILLAFVLTAVVLYRGGEVPAYQDEAPKVGAVKASSPAEKAGILPGDVILSVAGHRVSTWEDVFIAIGTRPNREIAISVMHDGIETTKAITPVTAPDSGQFDIGDIGVMPNVHPQLIAVDPGQPASRAGFQVGDVVMSVNGEAMTLSSQLKDAIAKYPNKPVVVTVRRGGAEQDISVTPELSGKIGLIGVSIMDEMKSIKPGPLEAVEMSVTTNLRSAAVIFQTVWGLITRETSPKQLMGPVAIAQLSGESAHLGWIALMSLMATISLNLGLVNLLPIPVLDGGHIFIMAIEGLARRDFSIRVKEKMLMAGFVVLMMLMVTVIYNDLARITWIQHLMPWR